MSGIEPAQPSAAIPAELVPTFETIWSASPYERLLTNGDLQPRSADLSELEARAAADGTHIEIEVISAEHNIYRAVARAAPERSHASLAMSAGQRESRRADAGGHDLECRVLASHYAGRCCNGCGSWVLADVRAKHRDADPRLELDCQTAAGAHTRQRRELFERLLETKDKRGRRLQRWWIERRLW